MMSMDMDGHVVQMRMDKFRVPCILRLVSTTGAVS